MVDVNVSEIIHEIIYGSKYDKIKPFVLRRNGYGRYVCNICGLGGFTARGLELHLLAKHRDIIRYLVLESNILEHYNSGEIDVDIPEKNKCRVISVKIPVRLYSMLKVLAEKNNTSMTELVRQAIVELSYNLAPLRYKLDDAGIKLENTRVFTMKLTRDEIAVLDRASHATGLLRSEIIRRLILYVVSEKTDNTLLTAVPIVETIRIY